MRLCVNLCVLLVPYVCTYAQRQENSSHPVIGVPFFVSVLVPVCLLVYASMCQSLHSSRPVVVYLCTTTGQFFTSSDRNAVLCVCPCVCLSMCQSVRSSRPVVVYLCSSSCTATGESFTSSYKCAVLCVCPCACLSACLCVHVSISPFFSSCLCIPMHLNRRILHIQ